MLKKVFFTFLIPLQLFAVFGTPITSSTTVADAINSSAGINNSGFSVVAWQELVGTVESIVASFFLNGAWSTPKVISNSTQAASNPQVAVNDSNTAVVVWEQLSGSNTLIQAASLTSTSSNGTWTLPITLSATGQNGLSPQVALNNCGFALALWEEQSGSTSIIQASNFTSTTGWSVPANLSSTTGFGTNPSLSMNSSSNAIATWQEVSGNFVIQRSFYTISNGLWSTALTISVQ